MTSRESTIPVGNTTSASRPDLIRELIRSQPAAPVVPTTCGKIFETSIGQRRCLMPAPHNEDCVAYYEAGVACSSENVNPSTELPHASPVVVEEAATPPDFERLLTDCITAAVESANRRSVTGELWEARDKVLAAFTESQSRCAELERERDEAFDVIGRNSADINATLSGLRSQLSAMTAANTRVSIGGAKYVIGITFPLLLSYEQRRTESLRVVPWSIAEKAYEEYERRYSHQPLIRIAERGGFGPEELDDLFPNWRASLPTQTEIKL